MREYLLVFVVAAAVTYVATPLVRYVAIATGAFTPVRDRDVHATPIPRLGGVGIMIGFTAALAVASRLPFLSQVFSSGELKGIFIAASIVCLVGALDDIRELDWLTKLAGQILAAGFMAVKGIQLIALPVFGTTVLPQPVLVFLTVGIVVISTNAVNFIDGLDGLAAGVVGISALAFFAYSYLVSRHYGPGSVFSVGTFLTAAIVGCCAGFLPHNFHPARLFMGDSGALLLGLLLAGATVSMTSYVDPSDISRNQVTAAFLPILLPVAVLSLPLLDVVLAVIRRTRAGQRPWHPDSGHLHHRMLKIGHTHRRAVLLLYLWSAVIAMGATSLVFVDVWAVAAAMLVLLGAALVLTVGLPRWRPGPRL